MPEAGGNANTYVPRAPGRLELSVMCLLTVSSQLPTWREAGGRAHWDLCHICLQLTRALRALHLQNNSKKDQKKNIRETLSVL